MTRNKEDAKRDFYNMICLSWTYNRMTDDERKRAAAAINDARPRGNYDARWDFLQCIYTAFLYGVGYTGPFWRDTPAETENKPKF